MVKFGDFDAQNGINKCTIFIVAILLLFRIQRMFVWVKPNRWKVSVKVLSHPGHLNLGELSRKELGMVIPDGRR